MKFWVVEVDGATVDCKLTKKEAVEAYKHEENVEIHCEEVEVTAESIRRLLGNLGGYAKC